MQVVSIRAQTPAGIGVRKWSPGSGFATSWLLDLGTVPCSSCASLGAVPRLKWFPATFQADPL